jgi:hypothetical protein
MGVIGIIYEARPNVTSDAAAISLKAGSAVILRGGKEAFNSNLKTVEIMRKAIKSVGLPEDCIQLVTDTTRQSATDLMTLNGYIDVLIPRGGAGLIKAAVENSTVPVIETGTGNCHVYVDESANLDMANEIAFNARAQRPSVCNSAENLLVHEKVAEKFNRGYTNEEFVQAVKLLNKYNIDVVTHIMIGLPNETKEDLKNTINFINKHDIQGVKIHSTYIIKNTKLEELFNKKLYTPLTLEEYIELACFTISHLRQDIIIHRISGDAPKNLLVAPTWNLHKKWIINGIGKKIKEEDLLQGKFYKKQP